MIRKPAIQAVFAFILLSVLPVVLPQSTTSVVPQTSTSPVNNNNNGTPTESSSVSTTTTPAASSTVVSTSTTSVVPSQAPNTDKNKNIAGNRQNTSGSPNRFQYQVDLGVPNSEECGIVGEMLKTNFPMYVGKDCNGNFTTSQGYIMLEGKGRIHHYLAQNKSFVQLRTFMQTIDAKGGLLSFSQANITNLIDTLRDGGLSVTLSPDNQLNITTATGGEEKKPIVCKPVSGAPPGAQQSMCVSDISISSIIYPDFEVIMANGYAVMSKTSGKNRTFIFTIASEINDNTVFTAPNANNVGDNRQTNKNSTSGPEKSLDHSGSFNSKNDGDLLFIQATIITLGLLLFLY